MKGAGRGHFSRALAKERLEQLRAEGMTITQISEQYNVTPAAVYNAARRWGMPYGDEKKKGRRGRPSTDTGYNVLLLSQCEPQLSHADISRRIGISRERVRQILGNKGRHSYRRFCKICGKGIRAVDNPTAYGRYLCLDHYVSRRAQWVELTCETCGKTYKRTEAELRNLEKQGSRSRFCSNKCWGVWFGKNIGWGTKVKPSVTRTCQTCSKEFTFKEYLLRHGYKGLYCSNQCMGIAKRGKPRGQYKVRTKA